MTTLPGLLLLHGAGDDGACWGPFVARLRAEPRMADLVIATPDAPAHGGRRVGLGESISWASLLADAVGHAEALASRTGGPIVVAGHSMGSMQALGVSAHRPDLTAATFLEDPALGAPLTPLGVEPPEAEPVDLADFHEWFSDLQSRTLAEVVALGRAEHPTWDEAEYEPWARAKQEVDVTAFAGPAVFVHAETDQIVRGATPPVVVAAGLPDRGSIVAEAAEADLVQLAGWTVHRLPASHDVRRDAPDATVTLLAELIRSVAR